MNAAQQYAALYGPSAHELAQALPDIGDRLKSQLEGLYRVQTPERAELLAIELEGTRRHVLRFREALKRDATGNSEPPTV